MSKKKLSKLLALYLPYVVIGLVATNLGEAWRLAAGKELGDKIVSLMDTLPAAFSNPLPSLRPFDLFIGLCCGAGMRLAVYLKGKNAKKYRHGMEYGSARWGTPKDIEPFMAPKFADNIILTKTERLMMSNRPPDPKNARNKNVLVVGGSGSGKTRFFIKPNLLQCDSKNFPVSFVVTDPKGSIGVECGEALLKHGYKANASTEVVSDILFLQKRDRPADIEPAWVQLGQTEDGFNINQYFVDHPEMVLGNLELESTQYGHDLTVAPIEDANLADQLTEAVQRIEGQYTAVEIAAPDVADAEVQRKTLPADPTVKNFSYTVVDGEIYYRENSIMTQIELSDNAKGRVAGMVELRQIVNELIDQQLNDFPDEDIKASQAKLNYAYDAFTAKYGLINDKKNARLFDDDSSYYLLCSLENLDENTNVQTLLVAVHHLDVGWRPSDMTQRNGRIIRQGNQNKQVYVYNYVTESTFDAYLYQTLENKQKFISQIMTSKSPMRSCDDIDEQALSYAEIKALCAGDPRIREKMDLDVQVAKLKVLRGDFQNQKYRLEDKLLKTFPEEIQKQKTRIAALQQDSQIAAAHPQDKENFCGMTIKGMVYDDKKAAGERLLLARQEMPNADMMLLGTYRGFELNIRFDSFKNEHQAVLRAELSYPVSLGDDARGNITRLDNAIDNFADRIADAENALQNLKQQKQAAEVEVAKPFAQEEELAEKSARLAELNALLNIDRDRSSSQDAPEETEETETPATRPSVLAALEEKVNQPEPVKPFKSYLDKEGR